MDHTPRLLDALRQLLHTHRVAALATCDAQGEPHVSMVPYALLPPLALVLHVSGLAAHTRHLQARPGVGLMVMAPERSGEPVHATARLSLRGQAEFPVPGTGPWLACREAYLARFPEAEPMTQLADFRFVTVALREGRQIAGFGAARSVDTDELALALRSS